MKKLYKFSLLISFLVLSEKFLLGQGCSDAGFCTINNLGINSKQPKDSIKYKNNVTIGLSYGLGDDKNSIVSPFVNYQAFFNSKISISAKLTAAIITGKKGFNANISDLFLTSNFVVFRKKGVELSLLGGFKIPLNYSNALYKNNPLPLSYQSSLGTIDAIFGSGFSSRYVDLSAGFQLPFFQGNRNSYFAKDADTILFSSSNQFFRRPDALLRVTGHYTLKNQKWKFAASLLGIYHLGNDRYVNLLNQRVDIKNSSGLTLNGVVAIDYFFRKNQFLQLSAATPFIVRKIRPDGLTRSLVIALEYHILF